KDPKPLLQRYQVEAHLDALFSPTVNLPAGGYIVINQTEALVSIDINSGKATREHNIEDTATKTNLEACDEIARQLRLRDLAGLVVIDFIDMEENRNNRAVERRMKDALKNDRARIQVGRISHFGLLEMSRQRLRPGLLEGTMKTCAHCEGRGVVRSVPSCGLGVLRQIEEFLQKGRAENLTVKCAREVAFYLLNEKRDSLLEVEQQYGISIFLIPSTEDVKGTTAIIERAPDRERIQRRVAAAPVQMESGFAPEAEVEEEAGAEEFAEEAVEESNGESSSETSNGDGLQGQREGGRRRRRRGKRGGRGDDRQNGSEPSAAEMSSEDGQANNDNEALEASVETAEADAAAPVTEGTEEPRNGRQGEERHGRRRGRFGRGRDRNDRGPKGENAESNGSSGERAERPPREDRPPLEDRPRRERPPTEFVAPPPPVVINIPESGPDPEPRKWQPPAPTVAAEPTARKGGWWSKR
ncbi:MAG: ribonuclease E/G, partial [Aestuariivirga sp.]